MTTTTTDDPWPASGPGVPAVILLTVTDGVGGPAWFALAPDEARSVAARLTTMADELQTRAGPTEVLPVPDSAPLHEEVCFTCWLAALGVPPELAGAMLRAAFMAGFGSGLGAAGVPADAYLAIGRPTLDDRVLQIIGAAVREALAAPPSPDVAAAAASTEGGHHG